MEEFLPSSLREVEGLKLLYMSLYLEEFLTYLQKHSYRDHLMLPYVQFPRRRNLNL